jgi:hypothetical protein
MSLLTNGKIQAIVGKSLGGSRLFGEPAEIHRRTGTSIDDDGNPVNDFVVHKVTATPLDISVHRRAVENVPDTEIDIVVYQYNAPVAPRATDRVAVRGVTYELRAPVIADPAAATWTCRARRLA